jgi:altronate hydrolase
MNEGLQPDSFLGFRRADGSVGTRNYLGVLIAGNCAATAAKLVAKHFTKARLAAYPNVDGVIAFIHELGCGMEKSGEPMDLLRRSLGGTIRNPNVAGAVVMALGCDRNNIYAFMEQENLATGSMLKTVVLQEVGGTKNAVDQGIEAIESMLDEANRCKRVEVSAAELSVGIQMNLRESDARTAAIVDSAIDRLVGAGGTVVLSDTQKTGADMLAKNSTVHDASVREALADRVEWWQSYTKGRDTGRGGNCTIPIADVASHAVSGTRNTRGNGPSCIGTAPLQGVFGYAHPLPAHGLLLMDSPGHEAVASTGLVAAGVSLLGIGSRSASFFGASGVPTVKLAIDEEHYDEFGDDLDFDCSPAVSGPVEIEQMGQRLYHYWLSVASGTPTRSEVFGIDDSAFMPWPIGVFA